METEKIPYQSKDANKVSKNESQIDIKITLGRIKNSIAEGTKTSLQEETGGLESP